MERRNRRAMADRRQGQRRAQKKKEREKRLRQEKARRRSGGEGSGRISPAGVAEMPLAECVINRDWEEAGRAQILIARRSEGEALLVAGFLVDTWCRGLQDTALLPDLTPEDYETRVKPNLFVEPAEFVPCDPSLARNIVEGAIEFAERFGFRPNKRWSESRLLFAGIQPREKAPAFGKEGKACLRVKAGENVRGARARLDRTVGPGGYTVVGEEGSAESSG